MSINPIRNAPPMPAMLILCRNLAAASVGLTTFREPLNSWDWYLPCSWELSQLFHVSLAWIWGSNLHPEDRSSALLLPTATPERSQVLSRILALLSAHYEWIIYLSIEGCLLNVIPIRQSFNFWIISGGFLFSTRVRPTIFMHMRFARRSVRTESRILRFLIAEINRFYQQCLT